MLFKRGTVQKGIVQWGCLLGLILISGSVAAADPGGSSTPGDAAASSQGAMKDTFAIVGGEKISMEEFRANLRVGIRQRFFHGNIPDDELKSFRREVADKLVNDVLLRQEAERRGLKPDEELVEKKLKEFEKEYGRGDDWKKQRAKILASLREKLEQDSLVSQLEKQVKDVPKPGAAEVRQYYRQHPEKFTTPEALRVSMILLTVDPSSPSSVWRDAFDKAKDLVKRIRRGDDFAQLAYKYSGDNSAKNGGDLGFIHKGMLSKDAQTVIDHMKEGAVSDPVQLLRGIAIFRLDERKPPVLNDFDQVAARARALVERKRAEQAWSNLRHTLRKNTPFTVNETVL